MSNGERREQALSLAGVPALAVATSPPEHAAARGTVVLLHGLTASKEAQRTEAHSLADHGYLAVTLDAVGHGARRFPDFEARFTDGRGEVSFHDIVRQSAAEIPAVLAALAELGWTRPGRVGACGISMGGFILFGAITAGCAIDPTGAAPRPAGRAVGVPTPRDSAPPIDAAALISTSPRWLHGPTSPHTQLDRYYPTALLMVTGADDEVVSPSEVRALHRALVPRYAAAPDRLRHVDYLGERHMMSERGWHSAWGEVLTWFDRFLAG